MASSPRQSFQHRLRAHVTDGVKGCPLSTFRDKRVEQDVALLKRFSKSCELDFITFKGDALSAMLAWPGKRTHGAFVTIHTVRYRNLVGLPSNILTRPIARLELSIDLTPKGSYTPQERLELLGRCQRMLFRRMTPWRAPYIGDRVYVAGANRRKRRLIANNNDCTNLPGGLGTKLRVRGAAVTRDVGPDFPHLDAAGSPQTATVYYGQKLSPPWAGWPVGSSNPEAQVRVYIKVTDNGALISPESWTCRMEVTLNGPALTAGFKVSTIGDLTGAPFRRIAHQYLTLRQPLPPSSLRAQRVLRIAGRGSAWCTGRRAEQMQQAAYETSVDEGAFEALWSDHLLAYVDVPELTRPLLQAPADFLKTKRRRLASA